MKKILICLGIFMASVVLMLTLWGREFHDSNNLKEGGYQTFVAEKMTSQTKTSKTGRNNYSERTEYTLWCSVDAGGKTRTLKISPSVAYDTEDQLKISKYYNAGKEISGYIYYSTASDEVYFSKEYDTVEEFAKSKQSHVIWFVVFIPLFLMIPLFMPGWFNKAKIKGMPKELEKRSIVCSYRTYTFSILFEVCIATAVLFSYIAIAVTDSETEAIASVALFVVAAMFMGLAIFIFMMMKNRLVLFHDKGIIFIDSRGNASAYLDEEIERYSDIRAHNRHDLWIYTKMGKKITLNYYCTNFHEALNTAYRKYSTEMN